MSQTKTLLSPRQREAFSALMRQSRLRRGLTYGEVADAVSDDIGYEVSDWWPEDIERCPKRPLGTCTVRLVALMRLYGLTWRDVLEAIGVWDEGDEVASVFRSP